MTTTINIADIRVDGGTQSRAAISRDVVAEYAEAVTAGAAFPPIVVFFDGAEYWLGDGFHRYEAYSLAQVYDVPADVRQGTQRDAILFSVGANASHGLRRTNDDKRRAVLTLLNDAEWAKWSDREIARQCGVSHEFASRNRRSLSTNDSERRTYTTKHGATATMGTARIGRASAPPEEKPTGAPAPPVAPLQNPDPEPEAGLEPVAPADKERREIARLTMDAMIEEIVGLRADLTDAKAEVRALKAERDDLKAKLKEATSSDMGRALGNAQRRADQFAGRMNEYMATTKRLEFRLKAAEKRVKELEETPVEMGAL